MSGPIHLATPNTLGVALAKQRVADGFAQLKSEFLDKVGSGEMTWVGDTAHVAVKVMAQEATAEVAVTEAEIALDIHLPWLLAGFSGIIENVIKERAGGLLAPPAKPPV